MSPNAVPDRLAGVFRDVFKDPFLAIMRDTATRDIKGWDSFTFLNLVVALEEEFDVTFSTWDLGAFNSIGEVADLLVKKGVATGP